MLEAKIIWVRAIHLLIYYRPTDFISSENEQHTEYITILLWFLFFEDIYYRCYFCNCLSSFNVSPPLYSNSGHILCIITLPQSDKRLIAIFTVLLLTGHSKGSADKKPTLHQKLLYLYQKKKSKIVKMKSIQFACGIKSNSDIYSLRKIKSQGTVFCSAHPARHFWPWDVKLGYQASQSCESLYIYQFSQNNHVVFTVGYLYGCYEGNKWLYIYSIIPDSPHINNKISVLSYFYLVTRNKGLLEYATRYSQTCYTKQCCQEIKAQFVTQRKEVKSHHNIIVKYFNDLYHVTNDINIKCYRKLYF